MPCSPLLAGTRYHLFLPRSVWCRSVQGHNRALYQCPSGTKILEDARLKLDNNAAERQLPRVAVGRNNWLFAGSDEGGERACVLYSLVASCKLHGVNPYDYLRDVLVRISEHPARDILALSPKGWEQQTEHLDAPKSAAATG